LTGFFVGEFEMAGREDAQNVGFVGVSSGEKEDISRGLKPLLFLGFIMPGLKPRPTSEATTTPEATAGRG
jgi:hypothetical protein